MTRATVGIISVGDMGVGVARLLIAHDYRVVTNVSGRSTATRRRAEGNSIEILPSDEELIDAADYILSIVPPRDAFATADRIARAASRPGFAHRATPLYFLDLNAISPASADKSFKHLSEHAPTIRVIDGGIIGGPPKLKEDGTWYRPSIPLSGPHELDVAPQSGEHLASLLRVRHVSKAIGPATGLKMCFASLSKGLTGIAIQSFTTAHNLGVLDELRAELEGTFPELAKHAQRSLVSMPPKAYRWVKEMEEEKSGGFNGDEDIFACIARVYDLVANDTDLGNESTENRKHGKSAEDVASLVSQGTARRRARSI